MIQVDNLSKKFLRTIRQNEEQTKKAFLTGKKEVAKKEEFFAVDHISFTVETGEIVGILGPNGAGKTTLLRMLGTLMEPTEGSVTLFDADGKDITDPIEQKKRIGYLSGNTKLYHRMSTREMLMMLGEVYGMEKECIKNRIEEISQVLSMEKFIDNRIERLSTGQTQRASIARCLIHSPEIYIFDEPTLGLDIISADAIVSFMKKQKEFGKTVLYSTHYLEEAQFLCDRIIMIMDGKIVAMGTVPELLSKTDTENLRDAFHVIMEGREKE